ncbi:NADAR family protein [Micromonospora sp. HNM0581]|uniref:NADAR family protein n=1 Tax=Micromonospora sp. HNM0581 TaxID=2716341 RepID=UPI00146A20E2|nr:NADAR family protein [Micromonospora sp. HNM0581]NLU80925.1 NADAR family protein [Micromonospora sp. HNM0581]
MVTSVDSVDGLTGVMRAGARVKFLFFWGHQPQRDGSIGPGCLSQWWPAPFTIDGQRFATAAKDLNPAHPHAAKTLGRQVAGFDQQVWEEHRYDIVVAGSVAKFGQHPALRTYLLGTGERVLVEASPLDRVWGIGLAVDHPHATDPARWHGLSLDPPMKAGSAGARR